MRTKASGSELPPDGPGAKDPLTTTVREVVSDDIGRWLRGENPTVLSANAAARAEAALGELIQGEAERPPSQDATERRPASSKRSVAYDIEEVIQISPENRYQELEIIGRGGMGIVRRVIDRVLGRVAAMKIVEGPVEAKNTDRLRFLKEAQITGQLDHPSIVPVHEFGVSADGARAYFTMKLVAGESLTQLIVRNRTAQLEGRSLERLLGIFIRICEAVAFAHARRVIHRDLKPENIMVGSHGQVYVMDWGLARVLDGDIPSPVRRDFGDDGAGTPGFMAPEQAAGRSEEIDARTDIFGLGGILYAALTGRSPFAGSTFDEALANTLAGRIEPLDDALVPPELVRIVRKALALSPADRYPSVEALSHDVEEFLRGGGWFATQSFPTGTVVVSEGESGGAAYVLVEGRCQVSKSIEGKRVVLRTLEPGDVFGETAVFTSKPRSATVIAIEPITVKLVTRQSLELELNKNPWMGAFVRAVAERFREADSKLSERSATSSEPGNGSSGEPGPDLDR